MAQDIPREEMVNVLAALTCQGDRSDSSGPDFCDSQKGCSVG